MLDHLDGPELTIYLTQGLGIKHVNEWSFLFHLGLLVPPF